MTKNKTFYLIVPVKRGREEDLFEGKHLFFSKKKQAISFLNRTGIIDWRKKYLIKKYFLLSDTDLSYILAKMNWPKIIRSAIQGRPTSFNDPAILEWRNAGDEMFLSVLRAFQGIGLIQTTQQEIASFRRQFKNKI